MPERADTQEAIGLNLNAPLLHSTSCISKRGYKDLRSEYLSRGKTVNLFLILGLTTLGHSDLRLCPMGSALIQRTAFPGPAGIAPHIGRKGTAKTKGQAAECESRQSCSPAKGTGDIFCRAPRTLWETTL